MKISLDFWNTICISNPEFSKARKLLCREYNVDIELINNYKQSYLELEKQGVHIYRDSFMNINLFNKEKYYAFLSDMNQLFLKYSPLPIYKDVILDILNLKGDHQIYICSNTGLIHGDILYQYIWNELEIPKHMCKFSDQLGIAKPNKSMFFDTDWHIGDNEITDGGCQNYGIKFYHTKSPLTIKNFIHEHL